MNEQAAEKVRLPGFALMLVGLLGVLGNLIIAIMQTIGALAGIRGLLDGASGPEWLSFAADQWALLLAVVGFFVGFVVVAAGARLRALRSPGLVYLGALLAIVPCCFGFPCCCLGLPIGIWVLVVMRDEQVKASFI